MGSLTPALDRLTLSDSVKYSRSGLSSIRQIYVSFAANSDLCLSLLRRCADYGEKAIGWRLPSTNLPTLSCVDGPHDLREQTMKLLAEMTEISVGNVAGIQGLSSSNRHHSTVIIDKVGRLAKIQSCIQQGPDSRTEDELWVEYSAREAIVLGHGHG